VFGIEGARASPMGDASKI